MRGKLVTAILALLGCGASSFSSIAAAYERPGRNTLVTVTSEGHRPVSQEGDEPQGGTNYRTSLTPDGRFVAFTTHLPLVPEDDNHHSDVYVRVLAKGTTELISKSPNGSPGRASTPLCETETCAVSYDPSISADGRYVAYTSLADNLVLGDLNLTEDVFVYDRRTGSTELVSVNLLGLATAPNPVWPPASRHASIDDSGRFVSFTSLASDLVANDTNGTFDIFVRDRKDGTTERVSVASGGSQSAGSCYLANCFLLAPVSSISGNGRYVAFDSLANDLVEGDTNEVSDVFMHDRRTGVTERVSTTSNGSQAIDLEGNGGFPHFAGSSLTGQSHWDAPARNVSRNGRFVTFVSRASNLVPSDGNRTAPTPLTPQFSGRDVFVHDRTTGRTERISVTSLGVETNFLISEFELTPSISRSGRYVTFYGTTRSDALAEIGTEAGDHFPYGVVIHDLHTGVTEFVSQRNDGSLDNSARYGDPANSGRFVGWAGGVNTTYIEEDQRDEPIPEDVDPPGADVWVRDRGHSVGAWVGFSRDADGMHVPGPDDHRFRIATAPRDTTAAEPLETGLIGARLVLRPQLRDLFVRLDLSPSRDLGGATNGVAGTHVDRSPDLYGVRFMVAGFLYEIRAQAAGAGGVSGTGSLGLFRCAPNAPVCHQVQTLDGSIGVVGEAVVVSVPLDALGLHDGGLISRVEAFSALGTFVGGRLTILRQLVF